MRIAHQPVSDNEVEPLAQREELLAVARKLAREKPVDQITFSDIATEAGVHWTTVRRHLGSKADLRALLARDQAAGDDANPDTRTRILAAATRVFAEHGYAGASLDQVAADAGMTKGAVYWHFASKSDLFLALLQETMRQQLAALPGDVAGVAQATEPEPMVTAWLDSQFAAMAAAPNRTLLFLEFLTASRDPVVREQLATLLRAGVEGSAQGMQRLQESHLLADDVDPYVLAVFLQAVFNGLSLARLVDPERVQLQKWAPQIAQILWRGVRSGRGG